MKVQGRAAQLAAIAALSVACTAAPSDERVSGTDRSSPAGDSATPPELPAANATVLRHATRVLARAGVTSLHDADGGHRQMPNASLTGEWEGSPAIVYVAPVTAESSMLRVVSTHVIAGTKVRTVAPEDSAQRPLVFRRGSHLWQVTVTRADGIRSDAPKTVSLVSAILGST